VLLMTQLQQRVDLPPKLTWLCLVQPAETEQLGSTVDKAPGTIRYPSIGRMF